MPKREGVRRVVITFPLSPGALDHLRETLGDEIELVDVRAADGREDGVLVPSSSRQLIGKMREAFPRAAIFIVEVEDPRHGVELGGQVIRSLDAGADGYYVARSLDQLAGVIDHALGSNASSAHQPVELPTPREDELASILDRLIHADSDEAPAAPPAAPSHEP